MKIYTLFLASYLVLLAAVLPYWHSPAGSLHYDDPTNIVNSQPVQSGVVDAFLHPTDPGRNLAFASFAADVHVARWRGVPQSEQLLTTNVAIHAAAALAVLWLLVLLVRRVPAAALAAAIWAAHPIHTTAVAYVTQRMAAMGALGAVLAVCCWIVWRRSGRWRWVVVGALALAAGALSKPTALLAVPLVLVVDTEIPAWLRRASWAGVLAGIAYAWTLEPVLMRHEFSAIERLSMMPGVIVHQASQLVIPMQGRLALWHEVAPWTWWLVPGVAFLAAWAYLAARARGLVRMALMWPAVAMLLEYGPARIDPEYEYRLYLPSVGLALLLALVLRSRRAILGAVALGAVALGVLGLATAARVDDFRDGVSLWEHDAELYPHAYRAANNACAAHIMRGTPAAGLEVCRRATINGRTKPDAWHNYAAALVLVGRPREALAPLVRALRLQPDRLSSIHVAAVAEHMIGNRDSALQLLDYCLQLAPQDPACRHEMSRILRSR